MIAALAAVALAGDLGDLARTGEPAMAMRCHTVADFAAFGQAPVAGPQDAGPVHAVVFGRGPEAPSELVLEIVDPRAAALVDGEWVGSEATLTSAGDRLVVRMDYRPMAATAEPTALALRALREDAGDGCAVAVVGEALPQLPMATEGGVVSFAFRGWDQPLVGTVDLPAHPVMVELLDGEGEGVALAPTSVHGFATAVQVHGTLFESALAVSLFDEDSFGAVVYLMSRVPRRLEVARGAVVGLDERGRAWAVALPLSRPTTVKRARKLLVRILDRMDLPYTVLRDDRIRITPLQGPALLVGLRDGLAIVSTRDDVVQDALAGAGDPWLPPAEAPYGLRARVEGSGYGTLVLDEGQFRFAFTVDAPPDGVIGGP